MNLLYYSHNLVFVHYVFIHIHAAIPLFHILMVTDKHFRNITILTQFTVLVREKTHIFLNVVKPSPQFHCRDQNE